jgi:putative aldouronate transport system permease protein
MSISDPVAAGSGKVFLWPVGFSLKAYGRVFMNKSIWRAFYNTFWYTGIGTFSMVAFTIMGAYPLARKHFFARKFFNAMFVFTMFFWGGLIPFFQVVKGTGLYGSRWALVVPYLIETWNLIICRTFFQQIPESLYESAKIDGCNELGLLARITLPLSKQIIAVLALFYGISNWNGWFAAILFLSDSTLHPIQVFLKRVLVESNSAEAMMNYAGSDMFLTFMQVKYAIVIVASVPMLIMYPFVQKYFEKGIMIGSLKG